MVIGIITTIITLLIVALEVMIGYERGIRKNLIRAVMLVLIAVLTLFITPPIVELTVRELILTNNLYDYLYGLTGVNPRSYLFVQESAVNMFTVFLNPFIYVVLFWTLKLISFGIYLLIDRYIIKRRLMKLFPMPTKKSSIAGGVLGGFYAILIGAIFFMPVSAYAEILNETERATISIKGQEGAVSDLLGNKNYEIAVSYRRTPSYYFYKYTGSKLLGDAVFTSLSRKKSEAATVSVEQYIPSIVKVYQASSILHGFNLDSDTSDVVEYITSFNVIIEEFASQELITGTDQEKLSLVKDLLKQSDAIQDNRILQAITMNMEYDTIAEMQQDMKILAEFSTLLHEKEMVTDLMTTSTQLTSKELMEKLDDEVILRIADLLYSMEQAEIIVPRITEKLLGLLLDNGAVGADAFNQIENFGDTKQEFISVCQSGKQLAYLINNKVEEKEAMKFLEESLEVLGESRLVGEETLQVIHRSLEEKLEIYRELNKN
ncbi:MAG: hypothetical protein K0R34_3074 [Herbinix sp.]|nr:hypothetical protein [Herbinix sp.]